MEEKYYKRMAGILFLLVMVLSAFCLLVGVRYSVLIDRCENMIYVDLEKPTLKI